MASAGYLPPLSDRCSYPSRVPSQMTYQGDPGKPKTNEFKAKGAESPLKEERSSQQEGQSKKTGPRGTKLIGRPEYP